MAYAGGPFHGWQIQPGVSTVEGELTAALAQIAQQPSKVQGASRTDAGVHALGQVVHFDYAGRLGAPELLKAVNAVASRAVRLLRCETVESAFHARHAARGKLYRYDLWVDPVQHPMYRETSQHVRGGIDLGAMRAAAPAFVGEHDFTSLQAAGCDAPSAVLPLHRIEIEGEPPLVRVWVEGAAFLKYMVRTLVGTLLEVGRGRRRPEDMPALLAAKSRSAAGMTAQSSGLHLVWVRYPQHPWAGGAEALTSGPSGIRSA